MICQASFIWNERRSDLYVGSSLTRHDQRFQVPSRALSSNLMGFGRCDCVACHLVPFAPSLHLWFWALSCHFLPVFSSARSFAHCSCCLSIAWVFNPGPSISLPACHSLILTPSVLLARPPPSFRPFALRSHVTLFLPVVSPLSLDAVRTGRAVQHTKARLQGWPCQKPRFQALQWAAGAGQGLPEIPNAHSAGPAGFA